MARTLNWKLLLWTLAILVLIGIIVHFVHSTQVRHHAGSLLEQADRAKEAGELDQALTYYQHYLAVEPEDISAQTKFGLTLDQQGQNHRDVVYYFEKILKRDPGRKDLRIRLIHNLVLLYRFPEAIANIQTLMPQWEDKAQLEHMLGWCLEANGDYPKAADALARAIALDPGRIESYAILAEVLLNRVNQPQKAAEVMDKMVQANSRSFVAFLTRSKFYRQQNQLVAAETDLNKALELGPQEPLVLLAAADWAQSKGDLKKARELLEKAVTDNPSSLQEHTPILRELATTLVRLGETTQAEAIYEKLALALPGDLSSRVALFEYALDRNQLAKARVLLADMRRLEGEQGKFGNWANAALLIQDYAGRRAKLEEARQILEALARSQKSWSAIPLLQARIEDLEGNLDKAVSFYLQAVDLGARQARPLGRLVQLLMRFNRYLDAEQILYKIKELHSLPPELMRLEAELALANQNNQEALRLADKAISGPTKDYRDYLWSGGVYHTGGRDQQAEEAFRQAVALAPHVPATWIALTQQLTRMGQREAAQALITAAKVKVGPGLALYTAAGCFESTGQLSEAELLYEKALSQKTDDFVLLDHAADFFLHNNQPAKAQPFLEALLQLDSSAPAEQMLRARRHLALVLAAKKPADSSRARALLEQNFLTQPNNPADIRAGAFIKGSEPAQRRHTIQVFEETSLRQPLSAGEQLQLAQLYEADDNRQRTRALILTLLTAYPENPQFLAFYIEHLIRGEEIEQARAQWQKLERLEPDSARTIKLKEILRVAHNALS